MPDKMAGLVVTALLAGGVLAGASPASAGARAGGAAGDLPAQAQSRRPETTFRSLRTA